ncbi:AcrR family transcriptional regulator [Inquilinus ginsengisoli]|uniref:AcrR family transcriptional regulator n=1 Tax=Inquilinus ginsengisoli TaxID=363840 RepID=A0ABU1JV52_9PROT|nr:TetR/AcrR family transcriptional regulator [Inquilinus ginsengisoli]MDR6291435.1 AcrR family transcriptional regulator [Inquilinus ginsengisoli]
MDSGGDMVMGQDGEIEGKKVEIVKHAFDRFYAGGFQATGMEAALAGSGISKRTLYKYFPSKEDLIAAVLQLYSKVVVDELFGPVADIADPCDQIVDFFDVRKTTGRMLTRGCLGLKAAQDYVGKHDGIVELGISANSRGEAKFLELCQRAGFAEPERLAKQLNLILQGALALAHASGDTAPFLLAKDVASTLLEKAVGARRKKARSKH